MENQFNIELARKFHDTYERLAPEFGYDTRLDTREFDPDSPNGRLMIAVIREVLAPQPPFKVSPEEYHLTNLRAEWIKERDQFTPASEEWWKRHRGIYALDEAIHTLQAGRVWRYKDDRNIEIFHGWRK
jgi:hypothetical protein